MEDEVTLGELNRSVQRLERVVTVLSGQMTVALGPVGEMRVRVEKAEKDVDELWANARRLEEKHDTEVKDLKVTLGGEIKENKIKTDRIELRAAAVSGGITAVIFLIKFVFGK